MGIVSDSDFNSELENVGQGKIKEIEKGRKKGDIEVPDSLRKIIGETSEINGRDEAIKLAEAFGISPSSVSAYANGATSTATYDERPNLPHINKAKERISKRARNKLFQALEQITEDKLSSSSAKALSGIARDLSAVVKEMEPEIPKTPTGEKGPQFIIYAPQYKKEEHYDVIHAKE
jgi:transcriptional regulator with XRE-family HTH domain